MLTNPLTQQVCRKAAYQGEVWGATSEVNDAYLTAGAVPPEGGAQGGAQGRAHPPAPARRTRPHTDMAYETMGMGEQGLAADE